MELLRTIERDGEVEDSGSTTSSDEPNWDELIDILFGKIRSPL